MERSLSDFPRLKKRDPSSCEASGSRRRLNGSSKDSSISLGGSLRRSKDASSQFYVTLRALTAPSMNSSFS